MKFKTLVQAEIEIDAVRVELPVRYGDEDVPYDFPLRVGDTWTATIDMDSGQIRDWPKQDAARHLSIDPDTYTGPQIEPHDCPLCEQEVRRAPGEPCPECACSEGDRS